MDAVNINNNVEMDNIENDLTEVKPTDVSVHYVKIPRGAHASGFKTLIKTIFSRKLFSGLILGGGPGEGIFVEDLLTSGQNDMIPQVLPGYIADAMDTGHQDSDIRMPTLS